MSAASVTEETASGATVTATETASEVIATERGHDAVTSIIARIATVLAVTDRVTDSGVQARASARIACQDILSFLRSHQWARRHLLLDTTAVVDTRNDIN